MVADSGFGSGLASGDCGLDVAMEACAGGLGVASAGSAVAPGGLASP